jgi:hypothetical protein
MDGKSKKGGIKVENENVEIVTAPAESEFMKKMKRRNQSEQEQEPEELIYLSAAEIAAMKKPKFEKVDHYNYTLTFDDPGYDAQKQLSAWLIRSRKNNPKK